MRECIKCFRFGAKVIKFYEKDDSYTQKVTHNCVFSVKIPYNATWNIHFSYIIFQLKRFINLIVESTKRFIIPTFFRAQSASPNDRKWKFPFISMLTDIKQMFSFLGFWNFCFQFVSFGCFRFWGAWHSALYNSEADSQETKYDIRKENKRAQRWARSATTTVGGTIRDWHTNV